MTVRVPANYSVSVGSYGAIHVGLSRVLIGKRKEYCAV